MEEGRTFERAIANAAGVVKSNVLAVLEREPALSGDGRAALSRVVGKLMPLADEEWLRLLRASYVRAEGDDSFDGVPTD